MCSVSDFQLAFDIVGATMRSAYSRNSTTRSTSSTESLPVGPIAAKAPTTHLSASWIDRDSEGLTVSPIPFIDGSEDFCEVSFQDVFVPDSRRLGDVGAGWGQNTGELALERGGVDRWMSLMPVLENWAANQAAMGGPSALADRSTTDPRISAYGPTGKP